MCVRVVAVVAAVIASSLWGKGIGDGPGFRPPFSPTLLILPSSRFSFILLFKNLFQFLYRVVVSCTSSFTFPSPLPPSLSLSLSLLLSSCTLYLRFFLCVTTMISHNDRMVRSTNRSDTSFFFLPPLTLCTPLWLFSHERTVCLFEESPQRRCFSFFSVFCFAALSYNVPFSFVVFVD